MAASPFECVLRDRNQRNRCRDANSSVNSKSQLNIQRNSKELVTDRLHPCISISPGVSHSIATDENSRYQNSSKFSCCDCNKSRNITKSSRNLHFKAKNAEDEEQMTPKSRGHSRVLDRWAAQQARDVITTIELQTPQEAESLTLSNCHSVYSRSSSFARENSPARSDSSADVSVSSLVQKWQGHNAEAKHNQNQSQNNRSTGNTTKSGEISIENGSVSEADETTDKRFRLPSSSSNCKNLDFGDWESDRTANSDQVSLTRVAGEQISDGGERERITVADIIRKWKSMVVSKGSSDGNEYDQPAAPTPLERLRIGAADNGGEERLFSPRLRGRQAIIDLFMRMERDRRKEIEGLAARQAVSKFQQRGRIQSLLRLRSLRQEETDEELLRRRQSTDGCESNRSRQTITSLRERFGQAYEQDCANMRSRLSQETLNGNSDTEKPSKINQQSEDIEHQEKKKFEPIENLLEENIKEPVENLLHRAQDLQEENVPSSDLVRQESVSEDGNLNSVLYAEDHHEESILSSYFTGDLIDSVAAGNLDSQEIMACIETSDNCSEEEEEEEELIYEGQESRNQQFLETNLEWINDISRPRSYWEDRRQAWYQKIFHSSSINEEIRQLIERKSVSAVLASDFRERMDRLMVSCMQRQIHSLDKEQEGGQPMGEFLQRQIHIQSLRSQEEKQGQKQEERQLQEEIKEHKELLQDVGKEREKESSEKNEVVQENDEEGSPSILRYHDVIDFVDQIPSSQLPWSLYQDHEASNNTPSSQSSWSHYQDHEASDHVASTPFQKSTVLHSYDHDTVEGSSFKIVSSIEMELIYDLKARMEKMYHEVSELRKSIKSCMDMQVSMQNSIRKEVSAALYHSEREEKKESNKKEPKKGTCCICYERKVDSLLYRCGHMCTCWECAHELQWRSSGKCPICRAQIVDVVRAYPYTPDWNEFLL
ncbi:hypothetical protein Nepgr_032874 [Nepenthes gracilis]|uniref:RING-type domain-containing protein n=1 Tax=Nepenthes gracilis TaxID=150966 RepID=A0AAD3TKY0_NEPGR|nr:hypothetical protein Nepgr_032874 [Nepenthes gracilis]